MPYGTSDSFHTNFTLPEPCLASLPFDKTFDHNKSFQYTNLSKHPITSRETCHLPVSIPSGICSSHQSNNITVNLMQSDTLGSGIHKVNNCGSDLFKTPLPALSVQSISQNLQSTSSVSQVSVTTSAGRFSGNNQSVASMQNLPVNSFSCTDFTALTVPQISSFAEDVKSTTMSSFSMANSSSNFGILSWSTIPPVAAASNISHNENFTSLRNSSDVFLPNISPPTTKIGIDINNAKNCGRSSSVCKTGQQQLKDCASEVLRHSQGIGPGYSFPITNETGQETVSSRGVINSLMPSSVQNNTLQQSSYKMSLPNNQNELGSDTSKGDYGNYRAAVSVGSESYKKFPLPQSNTYKLMTSHAEVVSRTSESQNYKQTSSPVPQNSYSVASSSVCGEAFSRTPLLHDKFKPQSSSQFDLYHSAPGIVQSDVYRTSQESHAADIPPLDQCGHFKPDFHANQKEQFKQNIVTEKPSNGKHLITSDGVNSYNANVAPSFKQDSYRFLAASSHCEQASKPGPACLSLDNYKSALRSNKVENYRKVQHSYQPEIYKRGPTSVACETHKSTPSSVQYNSCKPASSMPGEGTLSTNTHSRAPVNWMTTPDTRCSTQQISSLFFPPATSSQMQTQNNTPLPSSALFPSQCGHVNGQTATATTLFTSVPSQTSQPVILPPVTSSLFPPVTCNHRETASSTHSLFPPPVSSGTYNTNGNSMTSNIFTPASSRASSFPQVQSSLFPATTITTGNQSSLLFQSTTSNLLGQDNVSIPPMLLTTSASHVGQSGSSLAPLLTSVAARGSNQSSVGVPSINTMSVTHQNSTDRPLTGIPPALLPTSSDTCGKSLSLQPPLPSTVKPVSGGTHLGTLPPNTASHLFSRDAGNSFCSGTIFQSFPSSGPTVHDSSPSVLLMSGSNVMGDAASSSLFCPPHVTATSSDFSSGSAPFFSSSLIPTASSVASIPGQNNSCLPSSVPSTLLSTHTSSGNRQRDLNLFPGPPLPPTQHSYCRPSGPTFPSLQESGGASSSAATPPRPCFLSVSQLVEGSGSGKIGATRNSRRRSRRPPPPWVSGSSAPGNLYQNVSHSQQSLAQPSSNKTVQQLCGRQPRPRVIPSTSSELVDLGGLLGSPLLAEDQPPTSQRPSSPPTSVNSLTNFNLSTIFPEIDKQQQQQQSAAGYPKSTTMVPDTQQREFPHPPSTFGNVLMSPAQICRMQWP
ncbi:mucin-5AC-like isoform X1 [Schistocerca serialis cubense]|uniref:mucin-5AC-like isoform X1 n=1 Tax=Schistocerca serialis cubense TaxID=2023355 RepID=UPI00214ED07A|nr:mucin-5AC-like isoform X1 [Schistocerca serialis cubense]